MTGLTLVAVRDFILKNNAASIPSLPLIHSTQGFRLLDILNQSKLLAIPCNVFAKENLCYFFVGRPAYKAKDVADPQTWELPVVFVVRSDAKLKIKRIYPFDTGAFAGRKLPSHILGFPMSKYELGQDLSITNKLISTFFESNEKYLKDHAVSRSEFESRYLLNLLHMEILALSQMYTDPHTDEFDDRSSTVEVQSDEDFVISDKNLLGIVLPAEYRRVPQIFSKLKSLNCYLEFYDVHPVRLSGYYSRIYDASQSILKAARVI